MKSEVQKRIEELERQGLFSQDVEDDPKGRELMPEEIEYIKKALWQRIKTRFAFFLAYRFAAREKRKKRLLIRNIIGAENLNFNGGAILTANHFSPLDSFIMHRTFDASKRKGKFYRVIKESIRTSKKVNALSDFEFRLWIYLITYADDFGEEARRPPGVLQSPCRARYG